MSTVLKMIPSMSTLLSLYASFSAMAMLVRTIVHEMFPKRFRNYIVSLLSETLFSRFFTDFTFVVEDRWQAVDNEIFRAVELYPPTRIGTSTRSLLLGSGDTHNPIAPPKPGIPVGSKIVDHFDGVRFEWTLFSEESKKYFRRDKRFFYLNCHKNARDRVMQSYIPHIARTAQSILNNRQCLKIYTYNRDDYYWESTIFKHPSTFETLAMDPDHKQSIIDDLDMFVRRKEFFDGVGRAWKRGYLLYGPPGTGKSSLVAAIANRLRYNIYDLQIQGVRNDSELRNILTGTRNRSILLIEDIDCSTKVSHERGAVPESGKNRRKDRDSNDPNQLAIDPGVTLSGLLNFIDGLWSCCGDERIIIFTTNHKEKLDPALLRPGRMDVHIYMGYCTPAGFRKLAASYLGVKDHSLFGPVEDLLARISITPAEVAQQLMKFDKPDAALESLVEFLKLKEKEKEEKEAKKGKEDGSKIVGRQTIVNNCNIL